MADVLEKFQTIRTPGGEELVIMTRAEFDRLAALAAEAEEDMADVAAYDEAMARLASGEDERLPAEVSALILKGAPVLAAVRKWRGKTQSTLAGLSGLAQSYVSSRENGERKGTDDVWEKLAAALEVPVAWIKPIC